MGIVQNLKDIATRSRVVRHMALQYMMRSGQPRWGHVTGSPRYAERLAAARGHGKRILVATSLGGHLIGTRIESLLTAALTARGAEVEVLLCDGVLPACHQAASQYLDERAYSERGPGRLYCDGCFSPASKTYRSLGVKVHRYSEFLDAADYQQAEDVAARIPWDQIPDYREDNVAIGEHAAAGAIRFFAQGQLRTDPVGMAITRRYVRAAILTSRAARRLFEQGRFEAAAFHHGIYVPQGLIGELARQQRVRVINWHLAYRNKTFIFSHGDTYHRTMMTEPQSAWEAIPWTERLDQALLQYLRSRWTGSEDWIHFNRVPQAEVQAISREIGVDFGKPCIGLLTNVLWDAQLHYSSTAFKDTLEWVMKTIEYFSRRPDLQLLIRVHPAERTGAIPSLQPMVEEIRRVFPSLPPNIFVIPPESTLSTYTAMMQCNAAIIYGTKTGVELTSMGIPVIVAGEAWIRNKGISRDVVSQQEYFRVLDELPFAGRLSPEVVERARKYAFHFFFRRMIPLEFVRMLDRNRGIECDDVGIETLSGGVDRGLDVICDGILTGSPFIYPAEKFL